MELIIGGSESEIVLCENKEILDKVVAAREGLPRVKSFLLFDGFDGSSWDDASFTNKLKQVMMNPIFPAFGRCEFHDLPAIDFLLGILF